MVVLALGGLLLASAAAAGASYRGRPLREILDELRAGGLPLVYSSALVTEEMVVASEPRSSEPRRLVDEILAPLGLEARDGPGGAVLVVAASGPGSIRGRALGADGRSPVPRAIVLLDGVPAGKPARADGSFRLDGVAAGTHEIVIEAVGYLTATLPGVAVHPGETTSLEIELTAQPDLVDRVVVTPGRAIAQQEPSSTRVIDRDDALRVPALAPDVSRVVEQAPGVASSDSSALFHLRGSEARDVSYVLDGLELYEPFHLRDFQSPFSHVDTEVVDRIELLSGGFTAERGDRDGGFVDMETSYPSEPTRTRVALGTMNGRVAFASPTPIGSVLVAARAWYPDAVDETVALGEAGLNPHFDDLYAKLAVPVSGRTLLSFHALVAQDGLEFTEEGGAEQVEADARSDYAWMRAITSWSARFSAETLVSAGRTDRSRVGTAEPEDAAIAVTDRRDLAVFGVEEHLSWTLGDARMIRAGVTARHLSADYRYDAAAVAGGPAPTSLRLAPAGLALGAYATYRAALTPSLTTELGLRWDRQSQTGDAQLNPRLNLLWRIGAATEARFGAGGFSQSQRINELSVEDGERTFQPAERSRQLDAMVRHRFGGGPELRVDAYLRMLSHVQRRYENLFNPLELFPETETDRVAVDPDRARLAGTEVTLSGDPTRPLGWWIAYTWSSADDRIDGRAVPRSWDQTHAGSFLLSYRWADRWSASLSGTLHTGWPTTPVSGRAVTRPDGSTELVPVFGARNSDRYPTYGRLDAKVARWFSVGRGRLGLELAVLNLTDRGNVCCVDDFRLAALPDGTVAADPELNTWLGITPSFSISWEF